MGDELSARPGGRRRARAAPRPVRSRGGRRRDLPAGVRRTSGQWSGRRSRTAGASSAGSRCPGSVRRRGRRSRRSLAVGRGARDRRAQDGGSVPHRGGAVARAGRWRGAPGLGWRRIVGDRTRPEPGASRRDAVPWCGAGSPGAGGGGSGGAVHRVEGATPGDSPHQPVAQARSGAGGEPGGVSRAVSRGRRPGG